jgi:hypothetical protein
MGEFGRGSFAIQLAVNLGADLPIPFLTQQQLQMQRLGLMGALALLLIAHVAAPFPPVPSSSVQDCAAICRQNERDHTRWDRPSCCASSHRRCATPCCSERVEHLHRTPRQCGTLACERSGLGARSAMGKKDVRHCEGVSMGGGHEMILVRRHGMGYLHSLALRGGGPKKAAAKPADDENEEEEELDTSEWEEPAPKAAKKAKTDAAPKGSIIELTLGTLTLKSCLDVQPC